MTAPPTNESAVPLGIIGAGAIGGTVARLAIAAGWNVVIGNSCGPETLADLVVQLGPKPAPPPQRTSPAMPTSP